MKTNIGILALFIIFLTSSIVTQPVMAEPQTTMVDLGTLGGIQSTAYGINDLGEVVGNSYTASGVAHAFLWTTKY